MPPKVQYNQQIQDLTNAFGGANWADILNRLWMNGAKVADLQKALSTQKGVPDNPQEIVKRLLDQKLVTPEQLQSAVNSFVPPNAGQSPWPFRPETVNQQELHVPAFQDDATTYYPDAPRPVIPPAPGTIAATTKPAMTNVTVPAGNEKKDMSKATPAEVEQYEREHYGNMLWVKNDPELKGLLEDAARHEWTPERFKSEFENSKWWKNNQDPVRKFIERSNTDASTLNSEIDTKTKGLLATAQSLGLSFSYQDLVPMATDAIRFNWNDLTLKQNLMGKVTYDPNQAGGLGAFQTQAKGIAKGFLLNMTDEEAFDWSRKLFTGEASQESINEAMRIKAKGAYPSIADFIEEGGTPKDYFAQHVNTAAQLLEVDPSNIDLTDPKWAQVVSYADDKGNIRPMSVAETTSFVKQKDEYWKTSNSANEVAGIVSSLGGFFGRQA